MNLHTDFVDLLAAFAEHEARYLLIGGYAVGFHAQPRATKDMDLLVDGGPENMVRIHDALATFGAPIHVLEATKTAGPEDILFLGRPPVRVDILQEIPGVSFAKSYERRVEVTVRGITVPIIGKQDLIAAKRASGRLQDLADVQALENTGS